MAQTSSIPLGLLFGEQAGDFRHQIGLVDLELAGTGFFERTINFDVIRIRGVNGGTNRRVLNNIAFALIEEGTWI